jgi:hypothetical protein
LGEKTCHYPVYFYTVHHSHYTYVPAGALILKYLLYTVLVSTQHFLKSSSDMYLKNTG